MCPRASARAASSVSSRVLPMPAAPTISIACARRPSSSSSAASSSASSTRRPTREAVTRDMAFRREHTAASAAVLAQRSRPRYGSRPDVGSAPRDESAAMSLLDRPLVVVVLISALWWACSRHRRPAALGRLSVVAAALAAATVVFDGPHWQLVPWQAVGVAVGLVAAMRWWRPGRSRRAVRVLGRGALGVGLVVGALALLTALSLSCPHRLVRIRSPVRSFAGRTPRGPRR